MRTQVARAPRLPDGASTTSSTPAATRGRKVNLAYGQESLDAAQGCRIMDENERRMLLRRSYPKGKEVNQR